MKERPILMSAPMVRAILSGRKTQTRRVVKEAPLDADSCESQIGVFDGLQFFRFGVPGGMTAGWVCPYGQVGDRLWVKETNGFVTGNGIRTVYRADGEPLRSDGSVIHGMKWRPSIFMPRQKSRITLEITDARVERLWDITEADAIAEGVRRDPGHSTPLEMGANVETWFNYEDPEAWATSAVSSYRTLWNSINGPGSWTLNPWVWCLNFRRVE